MTPRAPRAALAPFALLLLAAVPARAQETCQALLQSAIADYEQGRFDTARDAATRCVATKASRAEKVQAYAVIARVELALDHMDAAQAALSRLLDTDPEFQPQLFDAPRFVRLLAEVRQKRQSPVVSSVSKSLEEPARGARDRHRDHGRGDPAPRLSRPRGRAARPARLRLLEAGRRLLLEHLPARLPLARDQPHAADAGRSRGQRPRLEHRLDHAADRPQQHRPHRGGVRARLHHVRRQRLRGRRQRHHQGPARAGRRRAGSSAATCAGRPTSSGATTRSTARSRARAGSGDFAWSVTARRWKGDDFDHLEDSPEWDFDPVFYNTFDYKTRPTLNVTEDPAAARALRGRSTGEASVARYFDIVSDASGQVTALRLNAGGDAAARQHDQGALSQTVAGKPSASGCPSTTGSSTPRCRPRTSCSGSSTGARRSRATCRSWTPSRPAARTASCGRRATRSCSPATRAASPRTRSRSRASPSTGATTSTARTRRTCSCATTSSGTWAPPTCWTIARPSGRPRTTTATTTSCAPSCRSSTSTRRSSARSRASSCA